MAVYPEGVHSLQGAKHQINWEKCKNCGKCTEICPTVALEIKGRKFFQYENSLKRFLRTKYFILILEVGLQFQVENL